MAQGCEMQIAESGGLERRLRSTGGERSGQVALSPYLLELVRSRFFFYSREVGDRTEVFTCVV